MSNILIIKHGSLGDIAQASGAIQDISENHSNDEVHLLTTKPYYDLFKKNPHISNVILDKRLPRFNLDNRLSKITFEICGFFLNNSKYGFVVSI